MSLSAYRGMARRAVHSALAAPASYRHTEAGVEFPVTVRHRGKIEEVGTSGNNYARLLASQDYIIFDAEELEREGLTPRAKGRVEIDMDGTILVFVLEAAEPITGPVDRPWRATQAKAKAV